MKFPRATITSGRLWLLLCLSIPSTVLSRDLVLVGQASADYQPLSSLDVRKVFLGYPVKIDGKPVRAIRNMSDEEGYQIFLQKLIHLSAKNYERRLLSKTFRTGTPKVSVAATLSSLKAALLTDESSISVMWRDEAESNDGLKVIQTLWGDKN